MARLYILELTVSPLNSVHKIGWTGRSARVRAAEVEETLRIANYRGELRILFEAHFIFAYPLEQFLHIVYRRKRFQMDRRVSGWSEFFDLNLFSVRILIAILNIYHCVHYLLTVLMIAYVLQLLNLINGLSVISQKGS